MAMRALARRLAPQAQQILRNGKPQARVYSTGERVLNEEEKAAENIYIKKMEQERREKLARKGIVPEQAPATSGASATPEPATTTPKASSDNNYRNIAVVAGLIAAIAFYWGFSGSSKKEEKDKD